ncbi:MAG: NAD(P)-dependent glycerol-3-phosphate dehydrogenase [Candidatus Zixiibacteriota bacterium]|nr:MAG: NAD(P)-dependent glycerol-3-phosphate dehydrogenase [candidate division Zixibacteria bacterium]
MSGIKTAILGAGSWGIAIANLLKKNSYDISMWEFDLEACGYLQKNRELPAKLPGIKIEKSILITNNLAEAIESADYVFCAIPAQYLRSALVRQPLLKTGAKPVYVNLAKGIEVGSLKRMSEVIGERVPVEIRSGICTLSGPSHAEEVARDIPTAVTVASDNIEIAEKVQNLFLTPNFRVYTTNDLVGVELAGSLKNVIALAAGMLDGLGLGDNTRGALITRGLAEIVRLGVKLGADPLTFSGLAGIGDLVTTCLSKHSRNRFVGDRIGRGKKLEDILSGMSMVAEGVETTKSARELALDNNIEMPITFEVYKTLFENKSPRRAISDLMGRDQKQEKWD